MIPVLVHFQFTSLVGQLFAYGLAVALVAYGAHSGWRGASGNDRWVRALGYGGVAAVVARVGLHYALPQGAFLGGRGEGLPVHTYGLMLATGFLSAVSVSARLAAHEWRGAESAKMRDNILDLAFWVLLAGIGGSKLLFTLVNWREAGAQLSDVFRNPAKLVDFLSGGLVFQGGLLASMATTWWFCKTRKIDFLRLCDVAIPTVSLGSAFGRLGCFSAGCCWGDVVGQNTLPWAVHFPGAGLVKDLFGRAAPTSSLAFQSMRQDARWVVEATGEVAQNAIPGAVRVSNWVAEHGHTLPVHPTQLYDSLGNLLLFAGVLFARRFRRFHGQIMGIWLMGYAFVRSTVETFRGDVERGTLHGLLEGIGSHALADRIPARAWFNVSTGQFISLCMFALGLWLVARAKPALPARVS
ncbi:MAG: prolipoprotein diacylglyceryl transferase [Myxococcaceae bacterium]